MNLYGFIDNGSPNSIDYLGLVTAGAQTQINNKWDALKHWRSMAGGSVPAGPTLLKEIKKVADDEFKQVWVSALQDEIRAKYKSKWCCPFSESYTHKTWGKRIGYSNAFDWSVGSVSFDVPDYEVNVKSVKKSFGRVDVFFSAERELTFSDEYAFNGDWYNPKHWFTDFLPEVYAGKGSSFFITGKIKQRIDHSFWALCWF